MNVDSTVENVFQGIVVSAKIVLCILFKKYFFGQVNLVNIMFFYKKVKPFCLLQNDPLLHKMNPTEGTNA